MRVDGAMRNCRGFTLIEFSIVLVVVGFLIGGVLVARDMIRNSEIRSVIAEYNEFETAVIKFKDKYGGLPGDIANATAFFGASDHCPGAHNQGTTDGRTCNGNGNWKISYIGPHTSPTHNEVFRFWQQLSAAGLINGTYDGVTTSPTGYFLGVGKTNSPASKLANGFWGAHNVDGSSSIFNQNYDPYKLNLGARAGTSWNSGGVLTGSEAWLIDTKMDDGKPGAGGLISVRVHSHCTNAVNDADTAASYVNSSVRSCFLVFRTKMR